MSILRTVIFDDGQNFKKNLGEFKFSGTKKDGAIGEYYLQEQHFDWHNFFQGVIEKFSNKTKVEHRLLTTA